MGWQEDEIKRRGIVQAKVTDNTNILREFWEKLKSANMRLPLELRLTPMPNDENADKLLHYGGISVSAEYIRSHYDIRAGNLAIKYDSCSKQLYAFDSWKHDMNYFHIDDASPDIIMKNICLSAERTSKGLRRRYFFKPSE